MTLALAKGGKFEAAPVQNTDNALAVSEKIYPLLTEADRRYIQREGNDVSVLAMLEAQLATEIKALQDDLNEDPRMKEIKEKRTQLRQAQTLRGEKTTKVLGVVESALMATRKGRTLATQMHELISLPAPAKALPGGKS